MDQLIDKLVPYAMAAAMAAAATGQLPRFIAEVRVAQLKLLKESQHWGNLSVFPEVRVAHIPKKLKSP